MTMDLEYILTREAGRSREEEQQALMSSIARDWVGARTHRSSSSIINDKYIRNRDARLWLDGRVCGE